MKVHKINQAVVTAAFTFLLLFSSTLMAELKVESDKDNVVSSRLEGRWQFSEAISTRLSTRLHRNRDRVVGFHADDKIVAKIPDKYGKFLKRKTIYMAGIMKSGKNDYPFILTEHKGNPHIVIFRERDGDPLGDAESFNVMLAVAENTSNDLLFIGGDFNNQPFYALERAETPEGDSQPEHGAVE